jgi:hypothetical protein
VGKRRAPHWSLLLENLFSRFLPTVDQRAAGVRSGASLPWQSKNISLAQAEFGGVSVSAAVDTKIDQLSAPPPRWPEIITKNV